MTFLKEFLEYFFPFLRFLKVNYFECLTFQSKRMKSSLVEKGDNQDITAERLKATFKVNEMANFIHGGVEIIRRRAEILEFVESRPEFKTNIPLEFLSREERYEVQAKKAVAMTDLATEAIDGSDFFGEGMYYQGYALKDLYKMRNK